MPLSDLTDANAVLAAIRECNLLGRDAFLERYGFGKAKGYFLIHDGKAYDSKAIAGAAYGYQHGTALKPQEFSGGESTVAKVLEGLGFVIERPAS